MSIPQGEGVRISRGVEYPGVSIPQGEGMSMSSSDT